MGFISISQGIFFLMCVLQYIYKTRLGILCRILQVWSIFLDEQDLQFDHFQQQNMCFEFYEPLLFHALVSWMALLIIAQCFFWVCWGYPGCCLGFPTSEHGSAMAVKRKRIKTGDGTTGFGPDSSALCTCHRFFGQHFRRHFLLLGGFFLKNRIWSNKLWQKNDDTLEYKVFFLVVFRG